MNNSLSEREQKSYLAVFKAKDNIVFGSNNNIKVFQFVDVHCRTSNDGGNEHRQWCNEITFVYSGEGEIVHNSERYKIKSGDVHLCFKDELHQVIPSKTSPLRFYCLGFSLDKGNPLGELFKKAKERFEGGASPVLSGLINLQTAFQTAMADMYSGEKTAVSEAVISNSLNFILAAVLSAFLNKSNSATDNISMKDSLLFNIVSYLKNNVYNIDALKNLPEDTGYSYSYISHLFSSRMGQSLKEFFASLRISEATELLKVKSVTEVSSLLGYSSIHAFTRAYKQMCGETPSEAKEKLNKKSDVSLYL
ncbi:MAG: AraC family transcriptional regulator [Oscillospiraceae bacterium]|nr:AraC family transcriptional regulator [Oscillospiraceae bacterium]